MRVSFSQTAEAERRHAIYYLAQEDPQAAARLSQYIDRSARLLGQFPHLGRSGVRSDIYELVVPRTSYILVYRLQASRVEKLNLRHTARKP